MDSRASRIVHLPAEIDANPYTRLFYAALARHGFQLMPDPELTSRWLWRHRRTILFLHFHWAPNDFYEWQHGPVWLRTLLSPFRLLAFAARLRLARWLDYRIVWTVHEVYPHGSLSRRLDRRAASALARWSTVLIAHDLQTAERLGTELGLEPARIAIVPHGSYAGFYPRGRGRGEVRAELGIPADAFVFLAFGSLKPYKRLDLILQAFACLEHSAARLVVAGNVREQEALIGESTRAAAARDARIILRLGLVPDDRVAELFEASDVVILGRSDGGTSGALILALGQSRAVIVARTPLYEQLTQEGAAAWFFEPGDARSLADALAEAAHDPDVAGQKGSFGAQLVERLSFDQAAGMTAELLRAAIRPA